MIKNRIKNIVLAILVPLFVLGSVFIMVSVYYSGHFFPDTWINGVNCSNKSVSEAIENFETLGASYTLQITAKDGLQEEINGEVIDYAVDYDGIRELKNEQGMWLWFYNLISPTFYTSDGVVKFDESKLKSAISSLKCIDTDEKILPKDAYVDYTDGIKVIPEVSGNTVNEKRLLEQVSEAIYSDIDKLNLEAADCYELPAITMDTESFKKEIKPITDLTDVKIILNFGENNREIISKKMIEKWLYLDNNKEVQIDESKVKVYVETLNEKYATKNKSHNFKTSYDTYVTVAAGNYGWSMDVKEETARIIEDLRSGIDIERNMIEDADLLTTDGTEFGDTYVEVSIDNQHVWFYKEGKLVVESDVVTGNTSKGHDTPKGAFELNNKARNITLTSNDPNDPYSSPVSYWLPFLRHNYGLHDASWRSTFGGSIYRYNGSHGCVNMPKDKVAIIYENIDIGTPVIVW